MRREDFIQRQAALDLGAATCHATHVPLTSEPYGTMPHRRQAVRSQRLTRLARQSDAIVPDAHDQRLVPRLDGNLDVVRACMLENVGQGLLHDSKYGNRRLRSQVELLRRISLGPIQFRASADIRYLPASGRKEPEVVEQGRAQMLDDAALVLDPGLQRLMHALEMRLYFRIAGGHAILDPGDVHPCGDQQPTELIVQLA